MIIITLGEKGGVGKSATADHFATAYFLKPSENKTKKVMLYEFDAHNVTSEDLKNDKYIETKVVREDDVSMESAMALIEFDAVDKDIIIDVGGSENTYRFLKKFSTSLIVGNAVFIVPEVNKNPKGAENTIRRIKEVVQKPKIILALNRYSHNVPPEEEFQFLFGNSSLGIRKSPLVDDTNIQIVTLPLCELTIGLADISSVSLWSLSEFARQMEGFSIEDRKNAWGERDKITKKIIPCTLETYKAKSRKLNASKKARQTIEQASSLFLALDKYRNT